MRPDTGGLRQGRFDVALVCVLYTLAHGPLLLNNGYFWDDWAVVGMRPDLLRALSFELGLPTVYLYHSIVESGGAFAYRCATFFGFLVAALALHQVLLRIRDLDRLERVSVVLVFALIPTASARIAAVVSWYAMCYALFFVAFWLMVLYLERRRAWLRLAALGVFAISFFLQSLLVLYAVAALYLLVWHRQEARSVGAVARLFLRYADFLLLPVVFWLAKGVAFSPQGFHAGYNELTVEGMLRAWRGVGAVFMSGVVDVLVDAMRAGFDRILLTGAIAAGLAWTMLRGFAGASNGSTATGSMKRWFAWVCAGAVATLLALFPYLSVGHTNVSTDWANRHQLLVPLGAALLIVFSTKAFLRREIQLIAISIVVACFVTANLATWAQFQRDWYKQVSLVAGFRSTPRITEARHLLIDDRASSLDALRREYRFYEYAGLLHQAFGDERRLARAKPTIEQISFDTLRRYLNERYRLGQFDSQRSAPDTLVVVQVGTYGLSLRNLIALRLYESFDQTRFLERVARVIQLCAVPIESGDRACFRDG